MHIPHLRPISIALLLSQTLACSHEQRREESYTPTPQTIHIKSDVPIYRIWNRWDESSDGMLFVNGRDVVSSGVLEPLLADDPSLEVAAKLRGSKAWRRSAANVSAIAATLGLVSTAIMLLLRANPGSGSALPSDSLLIGTSVFSGISLGAAVLLSVRANSDLNDALSIHNDRIWNQRSSPSVSFNLQVPIQ